MSLKPVELFDVPKPAAQQYLELPRGMQLRLALGTLSSVAADLGIDAEQVEGVYRWIGELAAAADYTDYHRAVARDAIMDVPEVPTLKG